MKKNVILAAIIIASFSFSLAEMKNDIEIQKKVAIEYFEKLTLGDIDAANELITVPFNLDMKKVLKTKEEVIAFHKKMLASKGKRAVPEYTCDVSEEPLELDMKVFPPYTPFRIKIKGHGHLDIYITNTKVPLVLGFAD